jgi:hypothetical protein
VVHPGRRRNQEAEARHHGALQVGHSPGHFVQTSFVRFRNSLGRFLVQWVTFGIAVFLSK